MFAWWIVVGAVATTAISIFVLVAAVMDANARNAAPDQAEEVMSGKGRLGPDEQDLCRVVLHLNITDPPDTGVWHHAPWANAPLPEVFNGFLSGNVGYHIMISITDATGLVHGFSSNSNGTCAVDTKNFERGSWLMLQVFVPPANAKSMIAAGASCIGKPYSWPAVNLHYFLWWLWPSWNELSIEERTCPPASTTCASLVLYILQTGGFLHESPPLIPAGRIFALMYAHSAEARVRLGPLVLYRGKGKYTHATIILK